MTTCIVFNVGYGITNLLVRTLCISRNDEMKYGRMKLKIVNKTYREKSLLLFHMLWIICQESEPDKIAKVGKDNTNLIEALCVEGKFKIMKFSHVHTTNNSSS